MPVMETWRCPIWTSRMLVLVSALSILLSPRPLNAQLDGGEASASPEVPPAGPAADPIAQTPIPAPDLGSNLVWRKGDVAIVPYGLAWLSVAFDTERTSPGSFTLFAQSPDVEGKPAFYMNSRATRLGLDIAGPSLGEYRHSGRIEIDFYGAGVAENRPGVLLRHAYGELNNDAWKFLGGQTWDILSPLNPDSINYTPGYAAGNIGYRRPQVRVERTWWLSDQTRWLGQFSLNRTVVTDFVDDPRLEGHDAGWPDVMGRFAVILSPPEPGSPRQPVVIGVSGQIGEELFDFEDAPIELDKSFPTWAACLDVDLPINESFGIKGEVFAGRVLGTYLGGINQGIDRPNRMALRSAGGWAQVWLKTSPSLVWNAGLGIDDPENSGLSPGRRNRNAFGFGNAIWNVTKHLQIGSEIGYYDTRFVELTPGRAVRFEWVARYAF